MRIKRDDTATAVMNEGASTQQEPKGAFQRISRELLTKPGRVFLAVALLFGLGYFLVQTNFLIQPDESTHWLRIYNLSQGNLFCEWAQTADECTYPRAVIDRWQEVTDTYEGITGDWERIDYSDTVDVDKSLAGPTSRSPLMYAPQVVGAWVGEFFGSTGAMILGGRLANFLVYVAGLFFIISKVRLGKWAFAAIGLIPTIMVLSASLSPDAMTNLVVFAGVAWTINCFTSEKPMGWWQRAAFAALCMGAALTKANSIFVFLPLLFLAASRWSSVVGPAWKKQLIKWGTGLAGVTLFAGSYAAWTYVSSGPFPVEANPPAPLLQEGSIIERMANFFEICWRTYLGVLNPGYSDAWMKGAFGTFASFHYSLPNIIIFIELLVILIAMPWRVEDGDQVDAGVLRERAPVGLWAGSIVGGVLNVLAVTYVMYTQWAVQPFRLGPGAPYADGVQGRYFTSLLVLLVPFFYRLRSRMRVIISHTAIGLLVGLTSLGCLVYTVAQTFLYFHIKINVP